MKREPTRDYVTEIFRSWAAAGMPTYEEARERIYADELAKRSHMDAETAVIQAESAADKKATYLLDILAAQKTMELLERGGKTAIIQAVKAVYFVCPSQPLRRGDVVERVWRFSALYPADTRTVYRWLKEARLLCAAMRGFSITDEDAKRYRIPR